MSYQALLFCLDEKLARVVSQVFSDLDFTVEAVNEPFAAVKKLMAQRYDAVVVDCENEPNATLLFKSARNSASNQSSLALALVEGQAGVAKAYRIGANLVLTKPINVEQAKGTLRVARGLLRKSSDVTATPAAPAVAKAAPASAAPPARLAIQNVEMQAPPPAYEIPAVEAELPAMAATAHVETPIARPVVEVKTVVAPAAAVSTLAASPQHVIAASLFEAQTAAAHLVPPTPIKTSIAASGTGAASAPAPAREVARPAIAPPAAQAEAAEPSVTLGAGSAPSFGALDQAEAGGSGSKKILIIAAVILVAAVLGYLGLSKSGGSSSAPAPAIAATQTSAPVSTAVSANAKPAPSPLDPIIPVPQQAAPQSKPSASVNTGVLATSPDAAVVTRKIVPPALVVKAAPADKNQASDDTAPQMPNPLSMASGSDKKLSGLVSAVPTALPAPSLSTVKISQGVSQGLLIKRVQPRYPQNALSMRIQGTVQLVATINKEGNISNLKVVSGDPILVRAATEAVHQWRYKPYYLNGEPVEIETQISINFKLPN
jgi:protein TonB